MNKFTDFQPHWMITFHLLV